MLREWANEEAREAIDEALQGPTDARTAARTWDDDEAWSDWQAAMAS